jgi:hypothetical protein
MIRLAKLFVAISLLLTSQNVYAKKYALVVGGAAIAGGNVHDTARITSSVAQGLQARGDYEVSYLLGDPNKKEDQRFATEMSYVRNSVPGLKPVTAANLDAEFERLVQSSQSGDQVEIFLNAHGSCDSETCANHTIVIYGPNGRTYEYPSNKIVDYLKKLDAKGVKTSLVMESCYSGALDNEVRKLKNTCTFLLASAQSTGVGCYTNEPIEEEYYTSTVEYVALRYYQNVMPKIKEGFYKNSSCLKTVTNWQQKHMQGADFSTISNGYWTAFPHDSNRHRPVLSSLSEDMFARMNTLSRDTSHECTAEMRNSVLNLQQPFLSTLQAEYKNELKKYDGLQSQQKKLIGTLEDVLAGDPPPDGPEAEEPAEISEEDQAKLLAEADAEIKRGNELETVQNKIRDSAQNLYRLERSMLAMLERDNKNEGADPCRRAL